MTKKAAPGPLVSALDRWLDRMARTPEEKIRRASSVIREKQAEVSVPLRDGCCTKTIENEPTARYELSWSGVFEGYSGYAKANKEIVLRLANTFRIHTEYALRAGSYSSLYDQLRMALHERVPISPKAPHVRFFGPSPGDREKERHRINYTMMETDRIHPEMVALLNDNYDEVWTPTQWNARAFLESGVTLPVRAMPLGINPWIYRPGPKEPLPKATLLTTSRAKTVESPKGFVFLFVFLPSFRKGVDILVEAFEDAFSGQKDAALVLGITHAGPSLPLVLPTRRYKTRIYALQGQYDELEMARVYRGCDAYVSPSRGEGWNLPLCEAAACGLPVIATSCTAHPEILGPWGYPIEPEGQAPWPGAEVVSPWYKDIPFPVFGNKSHDQLVAALRTVYSGGAAVRVNAEGLRERLSTLYTWDRAADQISSRMVELL